MNPILFSVGNINFYSFGIITLLSIMVGFLVSLFLINHFKTKIKIRPIPDAIILISLMGILGARFCFFLLNYYKFESFEEMFYYSQNGLVAWGGILAASLFCIGLAIKYHDDVWFWLDNLMIGFYSGFLIGNIVTQLVDKTTLIDYRIFWMVVTLGYLFYLRFAKIKVKLNGFLFVFGILSFCLLQIVLPKNIDIGFRFDFGQIFSLVILVLVLLLILPIITQKSLKILVWQGWTGTIYFIFRKIVKMKSKK